MQLAFNFNEDVELEIGTLTQEEVEKYKGRELSFQELEGMIGEKVIQCSPYGLNQTMVYRVVQINRYTKGCCGVYKRVREVPDECDWYGDWVNDYVYNVCMAKAAKPCFKKEWVCDQVGYADSPNRPNVAEAFTREDETTKGRWQMESKWLTSFYEIKGA